MLFLALLIAGNLFSLTFTNWLKRISIEVLTSLGISLGASKSTESPPDVAQSSGRRYANVSRNYYCEVVCGCTGKRVRQRYGMRSFQNDDCELLCKC